MISLGPPEPPGAPWSPLRHCLLYLFYNPTLLLPSLSFDFQLSVNTPPGTKIQILGKLPVRQGYLQVGPKNIKVLGGLVPKLMEKWEANRLVELTGRVYTGQVKMRKQLN
jgi:hypothetical protein